jgi:putative transposase
MADSENDALAYMTFSVQHRTKPHSTHSVGMAQQGSEAAGDVVGIFPNEASVTRLIDADPAELPPMAA